MTLWPRLRFFLRRINRRRAEREMDAEIRAHIAFEEDIQRERYSAPADAHREAMRNVGNVAIIKEDTRAEWRWRWIERLRQDLRYAFRMIRRRPGFSVAAVSCLALGIGANVAVFSLVNALLFQDLPVRNPNELVRLAEKGNEERGRFVWTYTVYDALCHGSRQLSDIIMMTEILNPGQIVERGDISEATVQLVSDNYFDALGVPAAAGRVFHDSSELTAVISDSFWRTHYSSSSSAIGSRFTYNNREVTVIGIAAARFHGTVVERPTDIWLPFENLITANSIDRQRGRWVQVMGRLRGNAGANLAAADAEANAILQRPVVVERGATGYSTLRMRLTRPLLLVELIVGLVMLLTCANLANLELAGASAREHELAVRRAVGASRGRLVAQLFTESLVLSVLGGALAVVLAYGMSAALLSFLPPEQAPALLNLRFRPDLRILGFAAALAALTGVLCGLFPALRVTRPPSRYAGKSWLSRGLIVCEVVVCTLLLVVSGLFVRSLQNLRGQENGYREDGLLVADVSFPRSYSEERRDQEIEELRSRVAGLPGVHASSFCSTGQLSGLALEWKIRIPGQPADLEKLETKAIIELRASPGFITAMGTKLIAGRDFDKTDTEQSTHVAIVNDAFAKALFRDTSPLGQVFVKEGGSRKIDTIQIVGIVKDTRWLNLRDEPPPLYYVPYLQQNGSLVVRFAVRADSELNGLATNVSAVARSIDRQMILKNVVPFSEIVNRTLVIERLVAQVSASFAVLALLIAALGLYGVLAYGIARRKREIGVRIAMGARPRQVEWMILKESLVLLLVGFGIGVPSALLVSRSVSTMLYGLKPDDPVNLAVTIVVLTIATVAASYLPARRASQINPKLLLDC